jgi:hypothetical protein
MTERPEAKRREEALGWLVGRLAWEKGLRFETARPTAETDAAAEDAVREAAKLPAPRKSKKAA